MSVKIHAIRTGSVQVKTAQRVRKPGGLLRILTDTTWTEWLPIYAWAIDHPEGVIVVDTGETSKTSQPGYFPSWHPYYRTSVRMDVKPEEEIGPQLHRSGITQCDIRMLVLTHFHTDHAGGLEHFRGTDTLVSGEDYRLANSLLGRVYGYLPHRWPDSFNPQPIVFEQESWGPFKQHCTLTEAGDVVVLPTPGHTPHHLSVAVTCDEVTYFLAGDTSYTQQLLEQRLADGVSPNASVTVSTLERILSLAASQPLVYLPSHDPDSATRLQDRQVLAVAA